MCGPAGGRRPSRRAQGRAPQGDGSRYAPAFSRCNAPEVCKSFAQKKNKGAGNAGCLLHPRSRVQCAQGSAHTSIQVQPEQPGIPCAVVLRLIPRSPRRRIPLASVAGGLKDCQTRSGRRSSAGLTPATGARTTRLCRTLQRQSSARCVRSRTKARPANTTTRPTLPRPPQPAPTFVTMANAPLPGRDGGSCRGDLGQLRRSIFLQSRLDRANHVEVVTENRFCAHRLFARSCKTKERYGRSAVRLARQIPLPTARPLTSTKEIPAENLT